MNQELVKEGADLTQEFKLLYNLKKGGSRSRREGGGRGGEGVGEGRGKEGRKGGGSLNQQPSQVKRILKAY